MYVIHGVSGNTGAVVASALLEAGKQVRVVVRDAAKGEPWRARGAEVAVASYEDVASLARALEDAEGAYLVVPPLPHDATGLATSRPALAEALVAAVRAARPRHVVALSSVGAQVAVGTGPIATLHQVEAALAATGVPVTFLRAAYFMENWGASVGPALQTGVLHTALTVDRPIAQVATRDIGRAAAALLLEPVAAGTRVVELSGPAEWAPRDVAAALSRVSGKQIRAEQVPVAAFEAMLRGFGFSGEVAAQYAEMTAAVNAGVVTWQGAGTLARRGDVPVEGVLATLLGA